MTIAEIEALARGFAMARANLADRVAVLEAETARTRRRLMPGIRSAASVAARGYDALYAAIDDSRDLFARPRSVVVDGIRLGLQKGKGRLEWDDDAVVCRLIRRHLSDRAELLIQTIERPSRAALARLPAAELKRLGVIVTDAGDQVLIKPADSAIDKLVAALLADAEEDEPDHVPV